MKTRELKRILLLLLAALSMQWSNAADTVYYHSAGDINKDGALNVSDVSCLVNLLLTDSALPSHDIDGDGHASVADVAGLIKYLLNGGVWPWPATSGPAAPANAETYVVNGYPIVMVPVEGGSFMMGSDVEGEKASPVHEVILTGYSIGLTEVTLGLWKAVMGSYPQGDGSSNKRTDDMATWSLNWYDYRDFIRKLNELTGLNFHFPTEAQWEFAARGGNLSHGYKYSGSDNLYEVAWRYTSSQGYSVPLTPVGQKLPNELGLYDMSGNVLEYCEDDWLGYRNPTSPMIDPLIWLDGSPGANCVLRGGYFDGLEAGCTVSNRSVYYLRGAYSPAGGLRLVLGGAPLVVD